MPIKLPGVEHRRVVGVLPPILIWKISFEKFSFEKILIWKILILQFQFVFDSPLPDTKDHIYKANRSRQTTSYMLRFTNI